MNILTLQNVFKTGPSSLTVPTGSTGPFLDENNTSIYGCIFFIKICYPNPTRKVQRDNLSLLHSDGSDFLSQKTIAKTRAIQPTLYTKKLKNRLFTSNSWNWDKIILLGHFQTVHRLGWFLVWWFAILITFIIYLIHAGSSQCSELNCDQAPPLFQIMKRMRFEPNVSQR